MELPVWLHPTAAGLSLAAAAVATGAPLFNDGLRALRLRSMMPRLREVPLGGGTSGLVHVRGKVRLESPLFSPISSLPCAGFRLEVRGAGTPVARGLDEFRPFRIVAGGASALVRGTKVRWALSPTAATEIAPGQPLTQNLAALLQRIPEALWLRRSGVTLRLTERALLEGAECHVVGSARGGYEMEIAEELDLARTGTDDAAPAPVFSTLAGGRAFAAAAGPGRSFPAAAAADVRIDAGEHLDFLLVSDRPIEPRQLAVGRMRAAGVAIGPLLSLAGMLYLANAADSLGALGRR